MKRDTPSEKSYEHCLIKPMAEDDDRPFVEPTHILDALIVACIVFFSVIGGDVVYQVLAGGGVYIEVTDVISRLVTAMIAFFMVFFAQWARYRGIKFMISLPVKLDSGGEEEEDTDN